MKLKKPLSEAELERQITAINALDTKLIDTSEIGRLTANDFKDAVFNPYYKPIKKQITVRLDEAVIEWLKGQGKGYQTKLNAIMKQAMIDDLKVKNHN